MQRRGFFGILGGAIAALACKVGGNRERDLPPRWPAICDKCTWLGRWVNPASHEQHDLWACNGGKRQWYSLIARYGPGSRYQSWTTSGFAFDAGMPAINEAHRRAVARGLVKKKEESPWRVGIPAQDERRCAKFLRASEAYQARMAQHCDRLATAWRATQPGR